MEIHQDADQTRSHWWWRPGWGPETRYLTFHLTFGEDPAVAAAARRYEALLESTAGVEPIPVPWLHLTMTGIGHASDVSAETLVALSERVLNASERVLGDGDGDGDELLVLDTFFLGLEAAMLTGRTPDWLAALKREQERVVEELLGGPREWAPFHPHVSLGYYTGEVDQKALATAAREVGIADVVVTRPTLSLLELRREGQLYTWRTLGERVLELGSSA